MGDVAPKEKILTSTQLYPIHVNEGAWLCRVDLRVTL